MPFGFGSTGASTLGAAVTSAPGPEGFRRALARPAAKIQAGGDREARRGAERREALAAWRCNQPAWLRAPPLCEVRAMASPLVERLAQLGSSARTAVEDEQGADPLRGAAGASPPRPRRAARRRRGARRG